MGAGAGGRLASKRPARDAAKKTEAGLSVRRPSSSERDFWGTLCAFGNRAAKAAREGKGVSKREAASQAKEAEQKTCPVTHEIFSRGSGAAKHAALLQRFEFIPLFLQIPTSILLSGGSPELEKNPYSLESQGTTASCCVAQLDSVPQHVSPPQRAGGSS